ncbi:polyketide synthase, partial [Cryptosporidium canis]
KVIIDALVANKLGSILFDTITNKLTLANSIEIIQNNYSNDNLLFISDKHLTVHYFSEISDCQNLENMKFFDNTVIIMNPFGHNERQGRLLVSKSKNTINNEDDYSLFINNLIINFGKNNEVLNTEKYLLNNLKHPLCDKMDELRFNIGVSKLFMDRYIDLSHEDGTIYQEYIIILSLLLESLLSKVEKKINYSMDFNVESIEGIFETASRVRKSDKHCIVRLDGDKNYFKLCAFNGLPLVSLSIEDNMDSDIHFYISDVDSIKKKEFKRIRVPANIMKLVSTMNINEYSIRTRFKLALFEFGAESIFCIHPGIFNLMIYSSLEIIRKRAPSSKLVINKIINIVFSNTFDIEKIHCNSRYTLELECEINEECCVNVKLWVIDDYGIKSTDLFFKLDLIFSEYETNILSSTGSFWNTIWKEAEYNLLTEQKKLNCLQINLNDNFITSISDALSDYKVINYSQFLDDSNTDDAENIIFDICIPNPNNSKTTMDKNSFTESENLEIKCINVLKRIIHVNKNSKIINIFVLVNNTVSINGDDLLNMHMAWVWGFLRSLRIELSSKFKLFLIDIDINTVDAISCDLNQKMIKIKEIISATNTLSEDGEFELVVRGDKIFVPKLAQFEYINTSDDSVTCTETCHIITGGLGGIGLALGEWLIEVLGMKNILLLSRNPEISMSKSDKWNNLDEKTKKTLMVEKCDISNTMDVECLIEKYSSKYNKFGIIHIAGSLIDSNISSLTENIVFDVNMPKIKGLVNLHNSTLGKNCEYFIAFSSISSLIGNIGQSVYAAANSVMDSIIEFRRSIGLSGNSLQWGAWAEQGMAKNNDLLHRSLIDVGLSLVYNDLAFDMIKNIILKSVDLPPVLSIQPANWDKFIEKIGIKYGILREIASIYNTNENKVDILKSIPNEDRVHFISNKITSICSDILGFEIDGGFEESLMEFGIDSIMAIEIRNSICDCFEVTLPHTILFDYPTISSLANYINQKSISQSRPDIGPDKVDINENIIDQNVAIVGIACRLPKNTTCLKELWELIKSSTCTVGRIPYNRWDIDLYYSENASPGKIYTHSGSFIDGIEFFDNSEFKISSSEAKYMDPQQRLIMETTSLAIKHSEIQLGQLISCYTGVFIGCSSTDWTIMTNTASIPPGPYTGTGISSSIISNRISYLFGFQGPSFTIDSACSSSLVALDSAFDKIKSNEIQFAVVGGVNLLLAPQPFLACCAANMLSFDGVCRTFDEEANGYGRGEGSISILLTRLSSAIENKKRILGVIKSTSVNQDGKSATITAPNGPSQQFVIKNALEKASLFPSQITYIETHGTGTKLGDPIEYNAIKSVFNLEDNGLSNNICLSRFTPLYLGAIKANIGHLEGAAGIAGLLKLILVLNYRIAVPIPNLKKINSLINSSDFMAVLPKDKETINILNDSNIIYGGVSSFGFGGTNAHVIVECNSDNKLEDNKMFDSNQFILNRKNYSWSDTKHPFITEKILEKINKSEIYLDELKLFRNINQEIFSSAKFILNVNKNIKSLVSDHVINDQIIWPAAGFIEMILAVARHVYICNNDQISFSNRTLKTNLSNLIFEKPLVLEDIENKLVCDLNLRMNTINIYSYSKDETEYELVHVSSDMKGTVQREMSNEELQIKNLKKLIEREYEVSCIYDKFSEMGIKYGDKFKTIKNAWKLKSENESLTRVQLNACQYNTKQRNSNNQESFLSLTELGFGIHPSLLDGALQSSIISIINMENTFEKITWVPFSISELEYYYNQELISEIWVHCKVIPTTSKNEVISNIKIFSMNNELLFDIKNIRYRGIADIKDKMKFKRQINSDYIENCWGLTWRTLDKNIEPIENKKWIICSTENIGNGEVSNTIEYIFGENIYYRKFMDFSGEKNIGFVINSNQTYKINNYPIEVIELFKNLLNSKAPTSSIILFITENAIPYFNCKNNLNGSDIWGLVRAARYEINKYSLCLLDLDCKICDICTEKLWNILSQISISNESEFIFRDEKLMSPRLSKVSIPITGPLNTQLIERGALTNLVTVTQSNISYINSEKKVDLIECFDYLEDSLISDDPILKGNEVLLRVCAVGLNFRDVLNVMDLYPGNPGPPCSDCSGIVVSVGKDIKHLKVGDHVYAMVPGCLNTFIVTIGETCCLMPKNCDFSLASSIPTIYSTVDICLRKVYNVKRGDRVLIHAASGGVGLVAVNYCNSIGAQVFATVGNNKKETYLKHLGVKNITSTRNPEIFRMEMENMLGDNGVFIELGKINIVPKDEMSVLKPGIKYEIVALDDLIISNPTWFGVVLDEMKTRIEECKESVIPMIEFSNEKSKEGTKNLIEQSGCVSGFRFMQKANHIGKVVIKNPTLNESMYNKDGIIIVIGGNGSLGKFTTKWLYFNGFKHLVILSRSSIKEASKLPGVKYISCDISNLKSTISVLSDVLNNPRNIPITGIIHAAGVLDDRKLFNHSNNSFEYVYKPKVKGLWNLHIATQYLGIQLEFLIAYSSIASLLGNIGQANYSAANFFMDSFIDYRSNLGITSFSIQWGPWIGEGMASKELNSKFETTGLIGVDKFTAIKVLSTLIMSRRKSLPSIICVVKADWEKLISNIPNKTSNMLMDVINREISSEENRSKIVKFLDMNSTELEEFMVNLLKEIIKAVITDSTIDIHDPRLLDKPLHEFGIDSLSAVEFRNILSKHTGILLPTTLIFDYPTINNVKEYVINEIHSAKTKSKPKNRFIHDLKRKNTFDIAVIGISCKLPGSTEDINSFWDVLFNGVDCISSIPLVRWDHSKYYCPSIEDFGPHYYANYGSFIDDIDLFDANYFGISPSEAAIIDPQQRLSLMLSVKSIENAQLNLLRLIGTRTGIYVGCGNSDWALMQGNKISASNFVSPYTGTSVALSLISNRISYNLGLNGPSMTMDTACSSSLVALDVALQNLKYNKNDISVVIGVNLLLSPQAYIVFSKSKMLSITGSCKAFDKDADGYVRGEGCCSIVLCRAENENVDIDKNLIKEKSKTNIYGFIKGSAINQDGRSASLTAPNGPAQQKVIMSAIEDGLLRLDDISIIEAHGTGTKLGDPIEFGAIKSIFGSRAGNPIYITALKTNIGHLEGASGLAGVIKMILMLDNSIVPKNLHFKTFNPLIDSSNFNAIIPIQNLTVQANLGGVSSFGFGGTNAHVIIENKKSQVRLEERSVTENTIDEDSTKILFMFTGQGSQFENMGQELFDNEPVFRKSMLECAKYADEYLPDSLIDILYPGASTPITKAGSKDVGFYDINDAQYSQVAIFSLEYSLSKLLESKGVVPNLVIGHSLGEYCAAVVIGVLELSQAIKMIVHRSKLLDSTDLDGGMLALRKSVDDMVDILRDFDKNLISIAAINGPNSIVISGKKYLLEKIFKKLGGNGKYLNVKSAFHSSLLNDVSSNYKDFIEEEVVFGNNVNTKIEFISTLKGRSVHYSELTNSKYWSNHITYPVLFYDAIISALNEPKCRILLEVGPKSVLTKLSLQCIPKELRTRINNFSSMIGKPSTELEHLNLVIDQIKSIVDHSVIKDVNSDKCYKIFNNLRRFPWSNDYLHPLIRIETNRKICLQNRNINDNIHEGLFVEFINGGVREIFKDEIFNSIKMGRYLGCEILMDNIVFYKLQKNKYHYLEVEEKDINGFKINVFSHNNLVCSLNGKILLKECQDTDINCTDLGNSINIEQLFSSYIKQNKLFGQIANFINELAKGIKSEISFVKCAQTDSLFTIIRSKDCFKLISKSFSGYCIHPSLIQLLFELIKLYNLNNAIDPNIKIIFNQTILGELFNSSISQRYLIVEINNNSANIRDMMGKQFFKTMYSVEHFTSSNQSVEYETEQFSMISNTDNLIWKTENQQILEFERNINIVDTDINNDETMVIIGFNDLKQNFAGGCCYSAIRSESELIYILKQKDWRRIIFMIDEFDVDEIKLMNYTILACKECKPNSNIWFIKINKSLDTSLEIYNKGGGILGFCKTARIELRKKVYYMNVDNNEELCVDYSLICYLINHISESSIIPEDIFVNICKENIYVYSKVIKPHNSIQIKHINSNRGNALDGVILISGGTGALGLIITEWLIVNRRISNIILLSRSGIPSNHCKTIWERILGLGSNVQIVKCDVGDYDSMFFTLSNIVSKTTESGLRITGLIHAAGVLNDSLIKNHSLNGLESVYRPKAYGAINLHNAIKKLLPYKLDFFIGFSSISSLFGSFGQYSYSSANSYLDSLIKYRRKTKESRILDLSIQWGPWAEQGMAANLFEHHSTSGIKPLYNLEGLACLSNIFDIIEDENRYNILSSELAIANIDWNEFLTIFEDRIPFIFTEVSCKLSKDQQISDIDLRTIKDKFEGVSDIRKYIEDTLLVVGYEVFGEERNNFDLTEVDSLMAVEFRNSIYKNLGIKLPISLMLDNPTLNEVVMYLDREVRRELFGQSIENIISSTSRRWEEISDDIVLDYAISANSISPDIVRGVRLPSGENNKLYAVFLTGGTGFMGTCMIEHLVKSNESIKIWCLVRCSSRKNGEEKLLNALKKYSIHNAELIMEKNIKIVIGDTSIPSMGIADTEYLNIANSVDSIIHIGAIVNFTSSYSSIKQTNVLSVIELLKLSSASEFCGKNCTQKGKCNSCIIPIHHISTLGVFYDHIENPPLKPYLSGLENTEFINRNYFLQDGRRIFYEDDPVITNDKQGIHHKSLLLGYSQSKWAAERLIRSARERGFSIAIYRPGRIGGNSITGASNISDLPNAFVKGCIKMGVLPITKMAIHLVPVDFCCSVCCYGVNNPLMSISNDFNLDSKDWASMEDIQTALESLGIKLKMIEFEKWVDKLLEETSKDRDHPLTPLQHMFVKEKPADSIMPYFDMKNTSNLISTCENIKHVSCDSNYLSTCFRYLLEKDWIYSIEYIKDKVIKNEISAKEYIFEYTGNHSKDNCFELTNILIFICDKLLLFSIEKFCDAIRSKYNCRCIIITIPNFDASNITSSLAQIIVEVIKDNSRLNDSVISKIILGSWSIFSSATIEVFKKLTSSGHDLELLLVDPVIPIKTNNYKLKIDEISFKILKKLVGSSNSLSNLFTKEMIEIFNDSDSIVHVYNKMTNTKNGSIFEFEEFKSLMGRLRTIFLASLEISNTDLEVDRRIYLVSSHSSLIGNIIERDESYTIVNIQNIYKLKNIELVYFSDEDHFTIFNNSKVESLVDGLSKIFS